MIYYRRTAEEEYQSLEKCPECGDIIEPSQEKWSAGIITPNGEFLSNEEYIYCSEQCAEKNNFYISEENKTEEVLT